MTDVAQQVRDAADESAAYGILKQALKAVIDRRLSFDKYSAAWDVYQELHGGSTSSFAQGGPRPGSNWTGD